jgi:hypothetical protein
MTALALAACFLLLSAGPASAQRVEGAIVGKVADAQGLALPGVTITVSSPSRIGGGQTATTAADGTYRVTNLPPGTYLVLAEMSGFASVKREGIVLDAGRTIAVDFDLQISGVEETVTVTGETPMVEVRNTRVGVTVDENMLENIPTGREFEDILNFQPGIVESPYTFAPVNSVHGSHVRANYYSMDGFQMMDTTVGYMIGDLSYDSLQEVQVTTGGISAEFGQASGGVFNFITKSGGNTLSGGGRFYLNDEALNMNNVSDELKAQGFTEGTSIKSQYNWGVEVGGPIAQDKVWFYGDYSRTDRTERAPALVGIIDPTYNINKFLGKVTWLVNPKNNFVGTVQGRHDDWVPANADAQVTEDPGAYIFNTRNQDNYLFKWTSTLSANAILEARYGENLGGGSDRESFDNADAVPGFQDDGTGKNFGWFRLDRWNKNRDAKALKVDLTYFKEDFGGKHDLKLGYENGRDVFQQILHVPGSREQFLLNGVPDAVRLWVEPTRGATRKTRNSFYINDQWTLSNVTLNLGLRFDSTEGWIPGHTDGGGLEASDEPIRDDSFSVEWFPAVTWPEIRDIWKMNTWAPRAGLVWDIGGRHTHVVKASYGRWYDRVTGVPSPQGGRADYEWDDFDGDLEFDDPVERGALRSSTLQTPSTFNVEQISDPNLKNPYTDTYNIGIDWQVSQQYLIQVTGIFKRETDMFGRLTLARPSSAYRPIQAVNPLDGQPITIYALDPAFRTASSVQQTTNPEDIGLERTYDGIEIVAQRRFDGRFQFQGSVNIGNAKGNQGTAFGTSTGSVNYSNPNSLTNFYGETDLDANLILKLAGTYVAPHDISVSGYYQYISGYPLDSFTGSIQPGSRVGRFLRADFPGQMVVESFIDVPLEPRGAFRQEAQHNLSFRVEKTFPFERGKLGVLFDVLNATNSGTVTHVQSLRLDAPNYLRPDVTVLPFTARFGVRYSF